MVERFLRAFVALAATAAAVALLGGCPLPFDFNARGAGAANASDPSSPGVTAPVTVSVQDTSGASATVANGGSFASALTTTVTLSTATRNAVIYYTDDNTAIVDVNKVKKISGSSGSFTITRASSNQTTVYRAVAIGPGMVPSTLVQATVTVTPYPIITITRDNAQISENGGTATFTLTSNVASASSITIGLQTSGNFKSYDFTPPIPASVVLPAGQTTVSVPTITAAPDTENIDDTLTVTVLPDSAYPSTYSVGGASVASVLIKDNQVFALALSADRSTMNDTQTATFTVTASSPAPSNLTVNLSSTGFTAGLVQIPSSVTLLAGQTTAVFQVVGVPQVGYQEQDPQISIAAGTGYAIGSPSSLTLQIVDSAVGAFTYDGVWTFQTGAGTNVGTGSSWSLTGNVTLSGGALNFGGVYGSDDAQIPLGGSFNLNAFTLGVQFTLADESVVHSIIAAGPLWRWLVVMVDTSGNLSLIVNNSASTTPALTGLTVIPGVTNTLVVTVDAAHLTIHVSLNGTTVTLAMPAAFITGNDMTLTADNYSVGTAFKGAWDWVFVSNGLLTYADVTSLVSTDPKI